MFYWPPLVLQPSDLLITNLQNLSRQIETLSLHNVCSTTLEAVFTVTIFPIQFLYRHIHYERFTMKVQIFSDGLQLES